MAPARQSGRGQTALDFLIGVGVFMLTIAFVVGLVPGLIEPFSDTQETPLVADRATSQAVDGMMAEPGRSSVLNETCTYAFFNASLGDGAGCGLSFDETEPDLATRVGIDDRYALNLTIERNVTGDAATEVLCTDGDGIGACGAFAPAERTRLAAGEQPPETRSIVSTRRIVSLDGVDVVVEVKVW